MNALSKPEFFNEPSVLTPIEVSEYGVNLNLTIIENFMHGLDSYPEEVRKGIKDALNEAYGKPGARRSKRAKRHVETFEYISAVRRFLRSAGERVADSDEPELKALLALQNDLDEAIAVAVRGQKSIGRSWAYISAATRHTRQAAFQRWGEKEDDASI